MRKPTISMYETEDADQLRGNRVTFRSAALVCFCFATKIFNLGTRHGQIIRSA